MSSQHERGRAIEVVIRGDTSRLIRAFTAAQEHMQRAIASQRKLARYFSWCRIRRYRVRAGLRLMLWWWLHGGDERVLIRGFCLIVGHRPDPEFDLCTECGLTQMELREHGDEWTTSEVTSPYSVLRATGI